MRAKREYVDSVTGASYLRPVAGSHASGRLVARVRPRKGEPLQTVEVDPDDILEGDVSYLVDPGVVPDLEARAAAAAKAGTKRKARKRRVKGLLAKTYRSAGQAAEEFYDHNHAFFEAALEADPQDYVRDWLNGIDVRRGRAWKRLSDTKKGRELLDGFRGTARRRASVVAVLRWLFAQNKSRQWSKVPWDLFRGFESALREAYDGPEAVEYPASSAEVSPEAILALEDVDPELAAERATAANVDRLREDLEDLRAAYRRGKACLDPEDAKLVRRRMRELGGFLEDPRSIGNAVLCQPEGTSRLCGFPAVEAEIQRLKDACRKEPEPVARADEDLDLPWENPTKKTRWQTMKADTHKVRWRVVKLPPPLNWEAQIETVGRKPGARGHWDGYKTKAKAESKARSMARDYLAAQKAKAAGKASKVKAGKWQRATAASVLNPGARKPPPTGTLPPKASRMHAEVYESARDRGWSKERAAKQAWGAVGRHYYRRGSRWLKRKRPLANPPKKVAPKRKGPKRKAAPKKASKRSVTTTKTTTTKRVERLANPGKVLKRGPIPLSDMRVTDLDRTKVIEARTRTHTYQWPRGRPMLWDPSRKAFVWFQGARERKVGSRPTTGGATKRVHDAWSWRGRQATKDVEFVVPSLRGDWHCMGRLAALAYRSPKDGRSEDYEHEVRTGAKLYRFGGARPPWVWVAKGGRLTVTKRGIVG